MTHSEPSPFLGSGQLHDLTDEHWSPDRLVWIDTGTGLKRVVVADNLARGGDGQPALVLRSYLPSDGGQLAAETAAWLVEWATPMSEPIPAATLHRTEGGARRRIAAVAEQLGVEVDSTEEQRVFGRMGSVGDAVFILRELRFSD